MDSVDSIEFNSEKLKYVNKTTFVATILQRNITVKYYSEILQLFPQNMIQWLQIFLFKLKFHGEIFIVTHLCFQIEIKKFSL